MELIFNPCGEFRWSPEGPVSQIHRPHLHAGVPGLFSDLLRSVQMLKREWCAESKGKLPHLFIPSKTATLISEFALENLPLGRTASLVSGFAVKPLGRTLMMMMMMMMMMKMKMMMIFITYNHRCIIVWGECVYVVPKWRRIPHTPAGLTEFSQ